MSETTQHERLFAALAETLQDFIGREDPSMAVVSAALCDISSNALARVCYEARATDALVREVLTLFMAQVEASVWRRLEDWRTEDAQTPPWE